MKNILVAFLLFAFVGGGYVVSATSSAFAVVVKEDEKDKKDKKSCDSKKSCCKAKSGEAKACAGMTKNDEAKAETAAPTAPDASASATAAPAPAPAEKKACCKKKASCSGETKEKSEKGATL